MREKKLRRVVVLFTLIFGSSCATARAIDMKELEEKLRTTGVEGEVHGASPDQGLYVFTYRNPKNFFDYVNLSLIGTRPDVVSVLKTLGRHDRVFVRGGFLQVPSPQKHVDAEELKLVKKYAPGMEMPPYRYEARIPEELLNKTSAVVLVHGVHGEGRVLVVEYKDAVVPVFVRNGDLTKDLFRNDLIRIAFKVQSNPQSPAHLRLDDGAPKPVEILDGALAKHGKPAVVEGALVLFPKSPQVSFNVFAVHEELPEGIKRQYTLINFDSPEEFKKIREKLQAAWDAFPGKYVNGRNKLVSTAVRVRATGTFNEVDPNQANVQILLSTADSIQILDR